jgi:altronate hydrolase
VQRVPVPASHLVVGLQCGGSDSYSGVSANLSETPEIYGAEHLLVRRAQSAEVGAQLLARMTWWAAYCQRMASGERSKSEVHGYGQNEFVPWQLGAVT